MNKFISAVLAVVGTIAATAGSIGCSIWFLDEPTMPKALIK